MGRSKLIDPPVQVHFRLPAALVARIYTLLYSDAHGGVPYGRLAKFWQRAAERHLEAIEAEIEEKPS